jgi:hypothetical protein
MKLVIFKKFSMLLLCLLCGIFLAACGDGGSDGGTGGGQGTLSTSLTDASSEDYQAVYVTIARVEVHHDGDGSWETVAEPNKTYNLLELVNGVRETLGIAALDAGHYTQMRLIIGETPDDGINILSVPHPYANYVIDEGDNEIHALKVPSGTNTGLKIVNGFDIAENQLTELVLDFDAMRSVVKAGKSGQYLLKPTVKVRSTIDVAVVSGTVTEKADPAVDPPVEVSDALVTAQTVDDQAPDAKDQVIIDTGTLSDINGGYLLILPTGIYNLVATKTGYLPVCTPASLLEGSTSTVNFELEAAAETGSVTGTVTTGGSSATVDFRQANIDCGTMITVQSFSIADGGDYSVDLPTGDYQVVAWSDGKETKLENLTVVSGVNPPLDFNFIP